MKTVMKTTVRVLPTGEIKFLGQEIPFKDVLGVVLPNVPERLMLYRGEIERGIIVVFRVSAHCLPADGKDVIVHEGSFIDRSYHGLLQYMKKMGHCSQDNEMICVATMSRDLFPDY